MKIYSVSRHISILHLQPIISNLVIFQNYNRLKNPIVEGCIKQLCDEREYTKVSDLIYNDRGFAIF